MKKLLTILTLSSLVLVSCNRGENTTETSGTGLEQREEASDPSEMSRDDNYGGSVPMEGDQGVNFNETDAQ